MKETEKAKDSNVQGILTMFKDMKLGDDKKEKILIVFLLGVFFLLVATPVGSLSGQKETKKKSVSQTTEQSKKIEKDAYISSLENKLEQTIAGMEGAGNVNVMITLKDNGEKILDKNQPYESEKETSSEEQKVSEQTRMQSEQETVLMEQDGNTEPIVVKERYPEIEGVVVVCEGGDNKVLTLQIKEAVQALFSVDAHKIVVCKSK
ncbi:MAG: stage III sporulation protein AG [Lachnospiraceae bacterium]|nr:stage III sporulation protein AG [Lachnospiraceae bacterium]HCJ09363.1 stage III sporulation protein AG [Lachnospiraceae bacterium]